MENQKREYSQLGQIDPKLQHPSMFFSSMRPKTFFLSRNAPPKLCQHKMAACFKAMECNTGGISRSEMRTSNRIPWSVLTKFMLSVNHNLDCGLALCWKYTKRKSSHREAHYCSNLILRFDQ